MITINHMNDPLGVPVDQVHISLNRFYDQPVTLKISLDADMKNCVCTQTMTGNEITVHYPFKPLHRYYVQAGDETAYFVTSRSGSWHADFISPEKGMNRITCSFNCSNDVQEAYISILGLGLYEAYLNGGYVNHEYLMPGCHSYDHHLQFQTYDISDLLYTGKNELSVLLGNGWYKGRMLFDGGFINNYGSELALIFEIVLRHSDGHEERICSDQNCRSHPSHIANDGIYDGECINMSRDTDSTCPVHTAEMNKALLEPRCNPRISVVHQYKPVLLESPLHEQILDFGVNLCGWVEFDTETDTELKFGEILQDGCFYNENYRTAVKGFRYISDGICRHVRPHFTFFGFRYVKVISSKPVNPADFTACAISSDLRRISELSTGSESANRLIGNIHNSQTANFLDVPTDCPQRDERLGWTGDAQIFSSTALAQYDCAAFFDKYMHDCIAEQKADHGRVPNFIPPFHPVIENYCGEDKTKGENVITMMKNKDMMPWGEAAVIIPWNVYLYSGDRSLLEREYPAMSMHVNSLMGQMEEDLIQSGFHFGDWLALDGNGSPLGATDPYYVACIYLYLDFVLIEKAASVLQKKEAEKYREQMIRTRQAIRKKYLRDGLITIATQTGYVLALHAGILEEDEKRKNADALAALVRKNNSHLSTGFAGTPYLCCVLAENGYSGLAYEVFLQEGYPGWLYEVNHGATTIWERWNSVLEDGHINPAGMNSLNHYANGALGDWLYGTVMGIKPMEPGFRKVCICPCPDERLQHAEYKFHSASGTYEIAWKFHKGSIDYQIHVPVGCTAEVHLISDSESRTLSSGSYQFQVLKK